MKKFKLINIFFGSLLFVFFIPFPIYAVEMLCARVKIEIKQELTLERQAFEAHMRINNGFPNFYLDNVNVDIYFTNENGEQILSSFDPENTDASFFIKKDRTVNIQENGSNSSIPPGISADIYWLIIPAHGTSDGFSEGKLYYVGADLTYTMGGEPHSIQVVPDYIFVKPMPMLNLDYFIPQDVYGDDAFTPEIEPVIPFSMGVFVRNNGYGTANELCIDSLQPKIIENEEKLLIGFHIEETMVNNQVAKPILRADFGDLDPDTATVARWIMTCSLSGMFVEYTAVYSHSDELGGRLTSLIDKVNTHFLIHDFLVDIPGRDDILDFLALDRHNNTLITIFESDNYTETVTDQSNLAKLSFMEFVSDEIHYSLSIPATDGFVYIKLYDLFKGDQIIRSIIRSDGKKIKKENFWLSKTRKKEVNWNYFFNLFDINSPGKYKIIFAPPPELPQPPAMQFIPDRTRYEKQQLSFIVEASDPNGTIPKLTTTQLPVGATFTDQKNGSGIFDWHPDFGQIGQYRVIFYASDDMFKTERSATLIILSGVDEDNDGMSDIWEKYYFNTLLRDGSGDYEGDGISDLDEYINGTNPLIFIGDINGDNQVDIEDVIQILQILSNISKDYNIEPGTSLRRNLNVSLIDAIYILQYISFKN